MKKVMLGIVDTPYQAELAVKRLESMGWTPADVAVLFPDKRGSHDFQFERRTKAPEGALAGIGLGAIIGALLGILVGVGVLVVPGLTDVVAAGPVLAALSGAAAIALVLAIIGALFGLGIPKIEAKYYAGKLKTGSILVAVHVTTREQLRRAREVFRSVAAEVTSTSEAQVPLSARP